jgi:hypothetical protein
MNLIPRCLTSTSTSTASRLFSTTTSLKNTNRLCFNALTQKKGGLLLTNNKNHQLVCYNQTDSTKTGPLARNKLMGTQLLI